MKQNTITALKKVIAEMVSKEVAKQIKYVVKEMTAPTTETKPVENTLNVKDPVLNKILNETQGGIPSDTDAYPTMGGGAYTTENMGQLTSNAPTQPAGNMPDFMQKAMSGHSAKVVKAIENKHGTKS